MPSRLAQVIIATMLSVALAACSAPTTSPEPAATTPAPAVTPTPSAAPSSSLSSAAPTEPASSSAPAKVNANTASVDEMAAAFETAGVPNAERWAREVEEYRPYSGTDNWAHLRDELDKYNIDDATFNKIISVLEV